ncbi:hypothetical protein DPQ33_09890 [Oceanidesulfovibrio indonesiensis]|uniref:Perosamine synthetase n=1 Tax=Oceanidesulfovibrio indonesiensis TaxID=54767 RepID=A0A7M3ME77_9BACT|nr:DegT/DnrJ/EryC1/StrS family aminotransferase [Oceanidesulfovibrio indonesiensis]TVM17101.1 hypothetical protein DPQ33_09890 [Oceanidesulfovibrio indonesiensis]
MSSFQVSKPVLAGKELEYVTQAIESGWISSNGEFIRRFEAIVSEYLGIDGGMAVCNGTAALHLACMGMNLEPCQEVIVPALTYVASANAVTYCGATPVFADVDSRTWNISARTIEDAWTDKTVGVMAVHLYGLPAPMPEIVDLCRDRGAWVIEDCAESFGAAIDGRLTGTFGHAASFSFYGNKIISTGEGGMVFVRDAEARSHVLKLRGQGMADRRYWHDVVGYNYRMTNVAAAIGLGQMEQAAMHLAERQRIATVYREALREAESQQLVSLPATPRGFDNCHWLFSLVLECAPDSSDDAYAFRQELMDRLECNHGIETRPFFVAMHKLPMYAGLQPHPLPKAEKLSSRGLNLPTYTGLAEEDIHAIAGALLTELNKLIG